MGTKRCLDVELIAHVFEEVNRCASRVNQYRVQIVHGCGPDGLDANGQRHEFGARTGDSKPSAASVLFVAGVYEPECCQISSDCVRWLREQCNQSDRIVAVAGGTAYLAATGFLDGLNVVCHWRLQEQTIGQNRVGSVRSDILYTLDRNVYTCAGALASVDVALRIAESDCGSDMAYKVAHRMLVPYLRSGNSSQASSILRAQVNGSRGISDLLVWLPENMSADLSVPNLARKIAMSPRNFARTFLREVGRTPAKYIEDLRLEVACREIVRNGQTISGAAQLSGLKNNEALRRLFLRHMGITPKVYRDQHIRKGQFGDFRTKADGFAGQLPGSLNRRDYNVDGPPRLA
jgi:transcriptional regulator GlxA family with amidase domain